MVEFDSRAHREKLLIALLQPLDWVAAIGRIGQGLYVRRRSDRSFPREIQEYTLLSPFPDERIIPSRLYLRGPSP